ncbi:PP2C family protein-serine/threonine phosphatase [uncultured Jatrophihabitans sp.]|uniref:PP2C family protein-serine/threonine phosphatase n=1 Tax=uncultured Jatrophihabitans sp. TaxID=1610747 RepID=UPI0035CB1C09
MSAPTAAAPLRLVPGERPDSMPRRPARGSDQAAPYLVRELDAELSPSERSSRHVERLSIGGDTGQRFARILSLACSLFAMPMSCVILIDGDTSFFAKPGELAEPTGAFAQAVLGSKSSGKNEPMVVEDATADPIVAGLAAVTGAPYLRFYAGVPLNDEDGVRIGTFCLSDTVPRRLDRHQLAILVQLAEWACRELIDSTEMARARQVQNALLPSHTTAPQGYELATVCRPSKGVGGDFFDHAMVAGRLQLSLVDVMGKGIAAGLMAASVRAIVRASVAYQVQTGTVVRGGANCGLADVVEATDRLLQNDLGQTGTLVTGFAASLEPASGALAWVDAGHGLALIVRADGTSERLAGTDMPVGLGLERSWTEHYTDLQPGDTLLVVSDGLLDLFGGSMAAMDHIRELVQSDPEPHRLVERITELTVLGVALDDVTAVALRRSPLAR